MRRRTTILDVLREECAQPQGEGVAPDSARDAPQGATSDTGDAEREVEDEPEHEAPRRRRRRRHYEDEAPAEAPRRARRDAEPAEDDGELERSRRRRRRAAPEPEQSAAPKSAPEAPETPRAMTTRPAGERPIGVRTDVQARRVTRATGRKRGLQIADWLQSEFSLPRGYAVAGVALLLVSLWGVFLLGRMNGAAGAGTPSGAGVAKTSKVSARPSSMAPDIGDLKQVTNGPRLRKQDVAGFKIAEYPAVPESKEQLRLLHGHLSGALADSGATLRALQVVDDSGQPKSFFLAVELPAQLVGQFEEAQRFFERWIQRVPALEAGGFRFDFQSLQPVAVDADTLSRR